MPIVLHLLDNTTSVKQLVKSLNDHPFYHRVTLFINPPEYIPPGDKFLGASNVNTGGVVYTVIYGIQTCRLFRRGKLCFLWNATASTRV